MLKWPHASRTSRAIATLPAHTKTRFCGYASLRHETLIYLCIYPNSTREGLHEEKKYCTSAQAIVL